jgi:hypothetical protein
MCCADSARPLLTPSRPPDPGLAPSRPRSDMAHTLAASSRSYRGSHPDQVAAHQRPSGRSHSTRTDPSTITSPTPTRSRTQISPGIHGDQQHPDHHNHSPPNLTPTPVQISASDDTLLSTKRAVDLPDSMNRNLPRYGEGLLIHAWDDMRALDLGIAVAVHDQPRAVDVTGDVLVMVSPLLEALPLLPVHCPSIVMRGSDCASDLCRILVHRPKDPSCQRFVVGPVFCGCFAQYRGSTRERRTSHSAQAAILREPRSLSHSREAVAQSYASAHSLSDSPIGGRSRPARLR